MTGSIECCLYGDEETDEGVVMRSEYPVYKRWEEHNHTCNGQTGAHPAFLGSSRAMAVACRGLGYLPWRTYPTISYIFSVSGDRGH